MITRDNIKLKLTIKSETKMKILKKSVRLYTNVHANYIMSGSECTCLSAVYIGMYDSGCQIILVLM